MDIYVARQPIYRSNMTVFGYELLYRSDLHNEYKGSNDEKATATLLTNSVLVMNFNELISDKKGFINFSGPLLEQRLPQLLPNDKLIIEILERVTFTEDVLEACRALKGQGYMLALDDFALEPAVIASGIVELADIIKIEFSRVSLAQQLSFMSKYRSSVTFLAEKIATIEEFELAKRLGYSLFQGFYFSHPKMLNATDITANRQNTLQILSELDTSEPNFFKLARIFQNDLGLMYKILRLANTTNYGSKFSINSVQAALARIGTKDLRQWMHILLMRDITNVQNEELIQQSMIRAKMLEQLAFELHLTRDTSAYFIAGMFSSLDVLTNQTMAEVTAELPLPRIVKDALNGVRNPLRIHLDSVLAFERADWQTFFQYLRQFGIPEGRYMGTYLTAIKWQKNLIK
ncbi:MAG: HDOD domain-containing protein [Sporolactobacillus sp.]